MELTAHNIQMYQGQSSVRDNGRAGYEAVSAHTPGRDINATVILVLIKGSKGRLGWP